MSVTRETLRQRIAFDLDSLETGTVDSATTTTFTDDELIDSLSESERFEGSWVWCNNTQRRISSYSPASGQVTISRSWTAPTAGDTYEIHTLIEPDNLNTLINRALESLPYLTNQEITVVSGQLEYDLSSYTWLTQPKQVYEVEWKQGDTANEYTYYPLKWWDVQDVGGTITLMTPAFTPSSGDSIILRAWRYYGELTSDSSTTDCPADWVSAAARMHVFRHLAMNGPAQDTERYWQLYGQAKSALTRLSRRYAPKPNFRVQHARGIYSRRNTDLVRWDW